MSVWKPDVKSHPGPMYMAIADALADDIQRGRLRFGARLPTHRDLADALGVTVGTVTRAYGEAQFRNLISGEVGRGTFVGGALRPDGGIGRIQNAEPGLIDLSLNRAIQGLTGPDLANAMRRLGETKDLATLLDYQPDAGAPTHRAAAAAWLGTRGLTAAADRVVMTCGAQNAITAVLSALTRPQDTVLTEALTYPGVKSAARLLHLRLEGLALDEEGIVPAALERALRSGGARVLYTIPTLQNPTAAVMSAARRAAVVELCRRYDATIVEDAVYAFLVQGTRPLAELAPERTYYIDSASKLLGGGLRVGMVLAPPGAPVQGAARRLASQVRAASGTVTPLTAELAARWYGDGTAERLAAVQRTEATRRQQLVRRLVEPIPYASHPYAPMIWLLLPEPWRMDDFVFQARNRGVAVTPGSVFAVGREASPNAVRVCLGGIGIDELTRGLGILACLLREPPDAGVSGA